MLIVFTTTPSGEEAESLAKQIIESKLAACVQILPKMKSYYFWEGKVECDSEHLLLIKTLDEKYNDLESFINTNHSYDVPEIVAVKSEEISSGYLTWMSDYLNI